MRSARGGQGSGIRINLENATSSVPVQGEARVPDCSYTMKARLPLKPKIQGELAKPLLWSQTAGTRGSGTRTDRTLKHDSTKKGSPRKFGRKKSPLTESAIREMSG